MHKLQSITHYKQKINTVIIETNDEIYHKVKEELNNFKGNNDFFQKNGVEVVIENNDFNMAK